MNEDRASRYHRLQRRAAVVSVALTGGLLGGLAATDGSIALREFSTALASDRPLLVVAVYSALLGILLEAVALPVLFYRTFLLDTRYGLSSSPVRAWVRDHAKSSVIGLLLLVAGAEVVYATLRVSPTWWWLLSGALLSSGLGAVAAAAPLVLLPVFYRVTPVGRESIRARLLALSSRAGVRVLDVYEWKLGATTRRANAALVGTAGTRRILVSDTLIDSFSDDEVEVILAHELGHHVHHDILTAFAAESARILAACSVAAAAGWALRTVAGLQSPADIAGLPLLLLAGGAAALGCTPFVNALSRASEARADQYALQMTGQAGAFISAMRRLAAHNLADTRPSMLALWLFHTHPPVEQRIQAAREFERTFGAAGEWLRAES